MTRLFLELWSVASRLLNVLAGGDADTTLSARVHIDGWRRAERLIDALFRFMPLVGGPNHCRQAWLDDVERARAQVERHELLG